MKQPLGLLSAMAMCCNTAVAATSGTGILFEPIAFSGEVIPNGGPEDLFNNFTAPVINNHGDVTFWANSTAAGTNFAKDGFFNYEGGTLRTLAREGGIPGGINIAPPTNGGSDLVPLINHSGNSLFVGGHVAYSSDSGASQPFAIKNTTPVAGSPSGYVVNFNTPMLVGLSDNGQALFPGSYRLAGSPESGSPAAVYVGNTSSVQLLALEGQQAPGAGLGVVFNTFPFKASSSGVDFSPAINPTGRAVFPASFSGPGINQFTQSAIYSGEPGSIGLIARGGDPAPGFVSGYTFQDFGFNENGPGSVIFGGPGINAHGDVVFNAIVHNQSAGFTYSYATYISRQGVLELVARSGDTIEGLDPAITLDEREYDPVINNNGQIAWTAIVDGPGVNSDNHSVMLRSDNGSVTAVARTGDIAPGTGYRFLAFGPPSINDNGEMAFKAFLTGPTNSALNNEAVFFVDSDGELILVAQEGGMIDIDPDPFIEDLRAVSAVSFIGGSGGSDGRRNGLNNNGQLAIEIGGPDFSGIFLATIPEPTSLTILGLGGMVLFSRRH